MLEEIELLRGGEGFVKIDVSYFVNEQRQKFYMKIFLTYVCSRILLGAWGVFNSATFEIEQLALDAWVETHAWSGFIWENFLDVAVGGYSAVSTVVAGFLVPKDNVEESLYIYICINTILCIEDDISLFIYIDKWYILNCDCPSFQNYFAASECQFADPSKYYNVVETKSTM